MSGPWKSIETKHALERDAFFDGLGRLSRRSFLKVAGLSAGLAAAKGLAAPHGFQPVEVGGFRFAYLSDTHLCQRKLTDRFVRAMLRAVDDLNALSPQPDFVLFGGDLAQLGGREELELGAAMLRSIKAPVKMVAGEHDWFLDLGERWRELFGPPTYSFDHKGVHFVTLMSVNQRDFWTARGLTPRERMRTVATLDSPLQSRFEVGREGREWLRQDLERVDRKTPLVVFSHSPLYRYYRDWNFWTEDAEEVQALLRPFAQVTVLHGHTHQLPQPRRRPPSVPRHAVHRVAVALRAAGLASPHGAGQPPGSLQSVTGLRNWLRGRGAGVGVDREALPPLGSEPGHGVREQRAQPRGLKRLARAAHLPRQREGAPWDHGPEWTRGRSRRGCPNPAPS